MLSTSTTVGVSSPDQRESALLHRSLLARPHDVISASGVYLTLADGRKILDGCAGAAVCSIGHGNQDVQAAVMEQMSQLSYVQSVNYTTPCARQLAEFIIDKGRAYGLAKTVFYSSGSEAMEAALKLARQYHFEAGRTERTRFISRRRGFHGTTTGAMSVSTYVERRVPFEGSMILPTVSHVSPAFAYHGQLANETEEGYSARLVEELENELCAVGPDTVAAFIAETVVGATTGCVAPPRGYFEGVRHVCDKYGVLLILDEVMCGIGRTGTYFAFEQEGDVFPDIVTIAKGLSGGYAPVSGIVIRDRLIDVLRQGSGSFNHGHTYQAHPVGCAAALAVQKVMQRDELVEQSAVKGEVLGRMLKVAFGDCQYVGDIRGRGLFWALEFVQDKHTKRPFASDVQFGPRVQQTAFRHGVAVYPGHGTVDGLVGDHVILAPPLTISLEELKTLVSALRRAYEDVAGEMFDCVRASI